MKKTVRRVHGCNYREDNPSQSQQITLQHSFSLGGKRSMISTDIYIPSLWFCKVCFNSGFQITTTKNKKENNYEMAATRQVIGALSNCSLYKWRLGIWNCCLETFNIHTDHTAETRITEYWGVEEDAQKQIKGLYVETVKHCILLWHYTSIPSSGIL